MIILRQRLYTEGNEAPKKKRNLKIRLSNLGDRLRYININDSAMRQHIATHNAMVHDFNQTAQMHNMIANGLM